jgi:hypothetical protein
MQVRTIATFKEARTFCPVLGTIGEIVGTKGEFKVVRFPLPMKVTTGGEVLPDDRKSIEIYFKMSELEPVT